MGFVLLRLLLLGLLLWIGYKLVRKLIAPPQAGKPSGKFEAMVSCSHCGLHLPQREAVQSQGRHYCCQEHAESDQKN